MIGTVRLNKILSTLRAESPRQRDIAAAEIDDLIEAAALSEPQLELAIRSLIAAAPGEPDPDVKESMYNALASAGFSPVSPEIDWDPVASSLEYLDVACLEHALVALGGSGQSRYESRIANYLTDRDETIRATASESLGLLRKGKREKTKPA